MPLVETIATVAALGKLALDIFGGKGDDTAAIKAHDDALDRELQRGLDLARDVIYTVYPNEIAAQKFNDITNTSYSFWNSKNYSQAKTRIEDAYNDAVSYAKQSGKSTVSGTIGSATDKIKDWLPLIGIGVLGYIAVKK